MVDIDRSDAEAACAYIDASPSPFHAVANAAEQLVEAGFTELALEESWSDPPERAFARAGGALVAWLTAASADQFRVIGAHTDSPNLRVKPRPDTGRAGWRQLGVEVYGSPLLNSWLDRDLGLSGRVALRPVPGQAPELRLMKVDRAVLRIPQLAVHLDRNVNENGLVLNRQAHLAPVWGVGGPEPDRLRRFLAGELDVEPDRIDGWDLMVHDLAPATLLGQDRDLVSAPRIDNLLSCWAAVQTLLDTTEPGPATPVVCLYDHEEVGSTSATGADSAFLAGVLERVVLAAGGTRADYLAAGARSICVSADGAHATHPNYADRHEPGHLVAVNGGPVIKVNANQRYATDAATSAAFEAAADAAGVPTQRFVSRSDLPCGSTIGPLTSARLAMPTVDVGVAQLSMHSARELCGSADPGYFRRALARFLRPA